MSASCSASALPQNYDGHFKNRVDGVTNHPEAKTGDYWLWDVSGGWRSNDERWRIQAWCRNCSDKECVAGLVPTADFFNQRFRGLPRTNGVTLSFQRRDRPRQPAPLRPWRGRRHEVPAPAGGLMFRTWAGPRLMDGSLDPSERITGRCYAGDPKTANYAPRARLL